MLSTPSIGAHLADSAIGAYQRYISPHKGFCCAYRVHTGRRSCSAYGRAVVQRLGLIALLVGLRKQFERCKLAYSEMQPNKKGDAPYDMDQDCQKAACLSCAENSGYCLLFSMLG